VNGQGRNEPGIVNSGPQSLYITVFEWNIERPHMYTVPACAFTAYPFLVLQSLSLFVLLRLIQLAATLSFPALQFSVECVNTSQNVRLGSQCPPEWRHSPRRLSMWADLVLAIPEICSTCSLYILGSSTVIATTFPDPHTHTLDTSPLICASFSAFLKPRFQLRLTTTRI
jgi:hypothetical protein